MTRCKAKQVNLYLAVVLKFSQRKADMFLVY